MPLPGQRAANWAGGFKAIADAVDTYFSLRNQRQAREDADLDRRLRKQQIDAQVAATSATQARLEEDQRQRGMENDRNVAEFFIQNYSGSRATPETQDLFKRTGYAGALEPEQTLASRRLPGVFAGADAPASAPAWTPSAPEPTGEYRIAPTMSERLRIALDAAASRERVAGARNTTSVQIAEGRNATQRNIAEKQAEIRKALAVASNSLRARGIDLAHQDRLAALNAIIEYRTAGLADDEFDNELAAIKANPLAILQLLPGMTNGGGTPMPKPPRLRPTPPSADEWDLIQ